MKHSVQGLRDDLDLFRDQLRQGAFLSLTPEEKQALEQEANHLIQKLASMETHFLTVGLLGGTGVGKSTIMNALAGFEIASASHRRPHTDSVLIYRHVKSHPVTHPSLGNIPWNEITHQADQIMHVLLCDLPDFDSLVGEHRRSVLEFLDQLDILAWITSPEKYGDGRFYEFLKMVPKARENFVFVLNKVDLLFQGGTREKGYEQLDQMLRSFADHIRDQGVKEPLIHAVSAQEVVGASKPSPWNHFVGFRREIFRQRDMKQIEAIKTGNLDVEIRKFFTFFEKEARNLENFISILEESSKYLEEQRPSWNQTGQDVIHVWLEKQAKLGLLEYQGEPFALVGPGYALALVLQVLQGKGTSGAKGNLDLSTLRPSEEIISIFQRRLEWVEEHLGHAILRQNLPYGFGEKLKERLDVKKKLENLEESFFTAAASYATKPATSRFVSFRALQWFAYLVVFVLFVLAVGGEKAWLDIFDHPGALQITGLLLSIIHNLFDSKGLAALGSFALINSFLAFRFYRRYRRVLQRSAHKKERALNVGLAKLWEEHLDALIQDLYEFKKEIQTQLSALTELQGEKSENRGEDYLAESL